jgi:hypothetical protein
MTAALCPDCRAQYRPGSPNCPACGLPLVGPIAAELGQVDHELAALHTQLTGLSAEYARVDARRVAVLSRRGELIRLLRNAAHAALTPAPPSRELPVGVSQQATAALRPAARAARTATEASGYSIQTVLLALGGLLLAVAAIAFTVFAWGRFGIPGRAIVLAGLTTVTLAVPAVLVRYRLSATAETIAVVGLVLVALDGYAAWRVGLFGVDTALHVRTYAGLVAAAVTVVGLCYSLLVPLRLPRLAAVLTGQAVLPLLASAMDLTALPMGTVAAVVVAVDLAVVAFALRVRMIPELVLAAVAAGVAAIVALTGIGWELGFSPDHRILPAALLLAGLGGMGLIAAMLTGTAWARHVAAAVAVLAVAVGAYRTYLTTELDLHLTAAGVLALLLVAAAAVVPPAWRRGALAGSGAVLGAAVVVPAIWTAVAAAAPLTWLLEAWSVPSALSAAALASGASLAPEPDVAYALAALAVAATVLAARIAGRWAGLYALAASLVVAALLAPIALSASLAVAVGTELVAACAVGALGLVLGARLMAPRAESAASDPGPGAAATSTSPTSPAGRVGLAATGCALLLSAHAAAWASANKTTTLVTLAAIAIAWAAGATAVIAWARRAGRAQTGASAEGVTGALVGAAPAGAILRGAVVAALLATAAEVAASAAALDATRLEVAYALVTSTVVALAAALALGRLAPMAVPAALAVVPVAAYAGALIGAFELDRAGRGLLAALSGTAVTLAATVVQYHRHPASDPKARQLGGTSILGLVLAAAALLPPVALAIAGPLAWVDAVWRGAPEYAGSGLGPNFGWSGATLDVVTLLVLGVAAAALAALYAGRQGERRPGWQAVLLAAAPAWALGALLTPLAANAPWPVGLAVVVALALAGAGVAAAVEPTRRRWRAGVGSAFAAVLGVTALTWSLAARPATLTVLATAITAGAAAAALGRSQGGRLAGIVVGALAALAEAGVVANAAGLPRHQAAYAVLGMAAVLAGIAAAVRAGRATESVGLEVVAAVGGVVALALTTGHGWHAATVLTVAGVATGLTALRRDHRPAAVLAIVLELAASWVWLGMSGVRVPEAYTLPAALIGLAAGLWAVRRNRGLSSWAALAPGLAAAFLPSLALTFDEEGSPLRPLLLGIAALGVTVAGAGTRRQAPFALGAVTVALVAIRQIWPYLPMVLAAVPTWVPLALGGLLLVALGATYEQRRNDLRRARAAVGRMR